MYQDVVGECHFLLVTIKVALPRDNQVSAGQRP